MNPAKRQFQQAYRAARVAAQACRPASADVTREANICLLMRTGPMKIGYEQTIAHRRFLVACARADRLGDVYRYN